jgi:lipid-A-disaccharide synthase
MKIFFSAGEPSGDTHATSLIHELQRQCPALQCVGFGGAHMQQSGCELLFPLTDLAVVGLSAVLSKLPQFWRLGGLVRDYLRSERPDAVVLVDFPGFNWWVARYACEAGVPVFYFLPPQIWAWASWRVRKMRRLVSHVLCSLPFEEPWYRERGVAATFTGHPYFDDLRARASDAAFRDEYTSTPEAPVIGILPGSRDHEVHRNFPACLAAAERIAAAVPGARFPVACFRDRHRDWIGEQLRACRLHVVPHVGRTTDIIAASHSCIAKSGSVSLELLFYGKPAVILYRLDRLDQCIYRVARGIGMAQTRFITLANIAAGREIYPEYVGHGDVSEPVAGHVLQWLREPAAYASVLREIESWRGRFDHPGACARTAAYILQSLRMDRTATVAA